MKIEFVIVHIHYRLPINYISTFIFIYFLHIIGFYCQIKKIEQYTKILKLKNMLIFIFYKKIIKNA